MGPVRPQGRSTLALGARRLSSRRPVAIPPRLPRLPHRPRSQHRSRVPDQRATRKLERAPETQSRPTQTAHRPSEGESRGVTPQIRTHRPEWQSRGLPRRCRCRGASLVLVVSVPIARPARESQTRSLVAQTLASWVLFVPPYRGNEVRGLWARKLGWRAVLRRLRRAIAVSSKSRIGSARRADHWRALQSHWGARGGRHGGRLLRRTTHGQHGAQGCDQDLASAPLEGSLGSCPFPSGMRHSRAAGAPEHHQGVRLWLDQ